MFGTHKATVRSEKTCNLAHDSHGKFLECFYVLFYIAKALVLIHCNCIEKSKCQRCFTSFFSDDLSLLMTVCTVTSIML